MKQVNPEVTFNTLKVYFVANTHLATENVTETLLSYRKCEDGEYA